MLQKQFNYQCSSAAIVLKVKMNSTIYWDNWKWFVMWQFMIQHIVQGIVNIQYLRKYIKYWSVGLQLTNIVIVD